MTLRMERLSESDFSSMAQEWQRCLQGSNANPVFLGWPWLFSWWEVWSQVLGLELVLIGVYDEQDGLIGLGPFYRRAILTPTGFRVYRLYLVGSAWRLAPTVRTEYCGFILPAGRENEVNEAILTAVAKLEWDELICSDVAEGDVSGFAPDRWPLEGQARMIPRTKDRGVRISVQGAFDDWLKQLGKNTRLKAYNRRTYLRERGNLKFCPHQAETDGDFFDCLNQFHVMRWGVPVFDENALRFHRLFIERLSECGGRAELTTLRYDGDCVSVLYDVVVGGWRLNLQAGFVEDFDSKVALGSLHLGFAVEAAFSDDAVEFYDLLAGSGKNHFYKSHFQGDVVDFETFQVVRNPVIGFLYWLQGVTPAPVSRMFNRRIGL
ncbi:GNAT family N-acetyltransferase [Marinobacter confluentis]|uniref:GNAT family N-acetyltransferase n=1 Tax=Marinobacter confluentis TaxID=1697557 RepID=A0A4Z1C7C3_9GAMM|nr:GNAT family N-acetyltransferase [Marinobacter confluentis]TGN41530.1 GNAT family N-acetyltransferase [Marinobacter confluentis]